MFHVEHFKICILKQKRLLHGIFSCSSLFYTCLKRLDKIKEQVAVCAEYIYYHTGYWHFYHLLLFFTQKIIF